MHCKKISVLWMRDLLVEYYTVIRLFVYNVLIMKIVAILLVKFGT